jgi:multiple sugar transport system permease protein
VAQATLRALWLPLGAFCVIALFPFTWMAATSLKTNAELYDPKANPLTIRASVPGALREPAPGDELPDLGRQHDDGRRRGDRHFPVAGDHASRTRLARMRFRGAPLLAIAVAVTYLVPQTLLFVPMADLIGRLKLGNTLSAVMLTYPTLLVPFIAWLLMGYFKTVPKELEEQALIDGASRWRAMTRVILPLCMPGFISAGIFAFTLAQNEFLYALLFLEPLERAHGPDRRRGRADPRRRVLLGPADGRSAARLRAGRPHLFVLREVLRRGPHGGRGQGLTPPAGARAAEERM